MERPQDEDLDFFASGPTNEELLTAKGVIVAFLKTMKNYGFYPEDHPVCRESLGEVEARLDAFLEEEDSLRFDVEMDRLLFKGEVVHQKSPGEENLGLLLFRDGIQWLEFRKGLDKEEISSFVKLLNQYGERQEDAEGDLVTALWEADFPHLRHKAVDVYWEAEPLIDLSMVSPRDPDRRAPAETKEEERGQVGIALPSVESTLWKLTPEEMRQLRGMIAEEERRDSTQDVLDMLLVILNDQTNPKDLTDFLDFIKEVFHDSLARGEFRFALELLSALHESRQSYKSKRPWALPVMGEFFLGISSPEVLGVLTKTTPHVDMLDSDRMKLLRQVLLLLPAEAILALGPMLLQVRSSGTRREFMEIMAVMAKRDLRPLARLLRRPETFLVQRLVHVLGSMKGEKPTQLLLKAANHPSERIRDHALRFLMTRDLSPEILEKLFPLIEDESEAVRELILEYLGSRRSGLAEGLLLDYLEKGRFQRKDREHLLACYKTLGRCGSALSIPFLRDVLLSQSWIPGFGRAVHRQGAAMSLMELQEPEAKEALEKASQNLSPRVRRAYKKASEVKDDQ
jgi:hypothetical protein